MVSGASEEKCKTSSFYYLHYQTIFTKGQHLFEVLINGMEHKYVNSPEKMKDLLLPQLLIAFLVFIKIECGFRMTHWI